MKTHINQIFTVVSFFSLSITTILVISWGMNGFLIHEPIAKTQCMKHQGTAIEIKQLKSCHKINESMKLLIPKITIKLNG